MKVAVFSCITNNYEGRLNNQCFDGADFFFYTENPQEYSGTGWRDRLVTNLFVDPRRNARYHKLLSHEMFPEYDYTVWLDGSIVLKVPAMALVGEMGKNDILAFKHPNRTCVYKEAEECLKLKLDDKEKIDFHVQRLKDCGYPENNGLTETKVVVRKNSPEVDLFNQEWFYQVMTGSLRDQLSFDYCAWLTGIKIKHIPPVAWGNEWFDYIKHHEKNERSIYK